tara:strand:+ start:594 stop:914 length:321 start_codon:yes stop_codon:yes gene_type:complete
MSYDHDAIFLAYNKDPNRVATIEDGVGCFDGQGNIIEIDQALVDAARVELNKVKYRIDRRLGSTRYADWREQLAMLYDDMLAGKLDSTGTFFAHNKAVKDANPKPS